MRAKPYCLVIIIVVLLTQAGCSYKGAESSPPIAQKEMVLLMYDLLITEHFVQQVKLKDSTINLDTLRRGKYQQVFQLHKTGEEAFAKTYNYYLGHPDIMKTAFDSIEARATRKKIQLINPGLHIGKPLPVADSALRKHGL